MLNKRALPIPHRGIVLFIFLCIVLTACSSFGPTTPTNPGSRAVTAPGQETDSNPTGPISYPPAGVDLPPYPPPHDPPPAIWEPRSGDDALDMSEVYINQKTLLVSESDPPQLMLHLVGDLPTPCYQLRVEVSEPDEQNQIQVGVYSLATPDAICIQVLEPFDVKIPLRGLPDGTYTIWVNGEEVGEINS